MALAWFKLCITLHVILQDVLNILEDHLCKDSLPPRCMPAGVVEGKCLQFEKYLVLKVLLNVYLSHLIGCEELSCHDLG